MTKTNSASLPAFLAIGCVGLFATPALAADEPAEPQASTIIVTGQQGELESPKSTGPLLDTPQTVTVISDQVLRKQNLLTLRDALQTIPGITFGAGEGGGGYGDSINLRGYSANNDLTIDGVRDSAQYTRSDPFNLQQIEVYNGANSVFNGSGSVGGTINMVSKTPQRDNLTIVSGAIGTDDYYRGTVDTNYRVSDLVAVRLNGAYHENRVPGRDVERFKRWGVAPSVTIGVDSPTSLTLAYVHQQDNNTPIYGVPYFKSTVNNGPLPGVDDSDYFGIVNLDKQDTRIDRLTATFRHAFSDNLSVRNLTRWQRVRQYSQTSAPQGSFCLLSTGLQPINVTNPTATVGSACPAGLAPGFYLPSGPRGLVRDQNNDLLINQTDLRWTAGAKGGLFNTLVIGASFSQEDYTIQNAQLLRAAGGALPNPVLPNINLANPDTVYTGPVNYIVTGNSYGDTRNAAVYAFDTLELNDMFEVNAAVRFENVRTVFRADTVTTPATGAVYARGADQVSNEDLFSYRFGAVFKPAKNISIYAAYGNAKTPTSASVRAGCGLPTAPGAADPCATAPEKAQSYEIGIKADLLTGLQATAAVFRNERTNFRVPSNDTTLPSGLQVLDGRSRVDGIALGLTGSITPAWTVFANYTYLDGRVIRSVSSACLATPSVACLNTYTPVGGTTTTIRDPQENDQLIQTPRHSGSLFTTYRLPFGLEIGYGLTYQGAFALNQRTLYGRTQFMSDDYLTHRLFVGYQISTGLTAQINVTNLTNEKYYTGIRNNISTALPVPATATPANGTVTGGWATPSERRQAVFSLFYSF